MDDNNSDNHDNSINSGNNDTYRVPALPPATQDHPDLQILQVWMLL